MEALTSLPPATAGWILASDIGGFLPAYAQSLADQGYALWTQKKYLRSLAHFARWMTHCRLAAAAIDDMRFADSWIIISPSASVLGERTLAVMKFRRRSATS